ncbi:magnesium transporter [Pontiella sulfatireligans]|uniref:Magnesium transporter MgtE n=1 Tax=Pontiella sulfatireligans TaxID=2750658 RepID=A0A6C2UDT2_9BACT|nr:magnesium transporter [Pontiella sulfatireligans]VGO18049.1 Magnesium transporter MgtE [Pontiella sulfatireligans]
MSDSNRITERITFCIKGELWEQIPKFFEELHPADIAEIINHAPSSTHNKLFDLIDDSIKPDVLAELDDQTEADILEELTDEEISDIIEEMAPDDAADVLGELEGKRSEEILELMENEESEEVRELLQYDEDTAGGIMTTDFVAASATMTAEEAIDYIGSLEFDEPLYYLYVVDAEGRMTGWIQLWELLKQANRNLSLEKMAEKETISVHTDTDQEEVARLASKYDLSSLPVLDRQNKLVGRITVDDIMDVMEEEASEDIFKLAGSNDSELEDTSPLQACKARLPWLLITLGTGFVSSLILKSFMNHITMSEVVALSFFVPIIMAMGGNTGIQSSTLIIRGIALGASHSRKVAKIITHEIIAGASMGLICGATIGLWARFMIAHNGPSAIAPSFLAVTVGIALFSAMAFAAVFGALVPVLLNRFKIDPAVASGPFVTASNDIFALLIYYGVTLAMISAVHAVV